MKFIVTKTMGPDGWAQVLKPVEHNLKTTLAISSEIPSIITTGELGQYFVIDSKYASVPEDMNKPNIYKMLCIGADIIPTGESSCKKHIVLFSTEIGDIHYDIEQDSVFFPVQIGQELLVRRPKDIDFRAENNGFKIVKNITIDKMRTDFVLQNQR